MDRRVWVLMGGMVLAACGLACGPARPALEERPSREGLPYAAAGLTAEQAAAHLLRRFTYGPRPGEVEAVVAMGLERWLDAQLDGDQPDPDLEARLAPMPVLVQPARTIAQTYPLPGTVRAQARREGVLPENEGDLSAQEQRQRVEAFMEEKGFRLQRELLEAVFLQKLLRTTYSENQLREVLTDFWFNHFNVAVQASPIRGYLLSYERDALRPQVLGPFRTLLGATARHPAMLLYLDNARSVAPSGVPTTHSTLRNRPPPNRMQADGRRRGVNENYARELLELHTLGVDAGYTQADVEAVARAFTGWTVLPNGPGGQAFLEEPQRRRQAEQGGAVITPTFLFRASEHDALEKTILGVDFPAGGGVEEGERVLDLLAQHPATARRIAHKLAVRFVADDPDEALVTDLAAVYRETGGDIRALVRALAYHPAFWQAEARLAKVKSPLELVASSLRALEGEVTQIDGLRHWLQQMGQPLYSYQAPTGYPDQASAWINAGTLISRMNFGMQLAAGRVEGVTVDLDALTQGQEPASVPEALAWYARLLLPAQDVAPTVALLLPLAAEPALATRLEAADDPPPPTGTALAPQAMPPSAAAHVVGVLLGAPAFQRR